MIAKAGPWTLMDGDESHAKYPGTFEMPSMESRLAIKVGDIVKVGFQFDDGGPGERIWFIVTKIHGEGPTRTYSGKLDNDPLGPVPDTLDFENRHILSIIDA